MVQIDLNEQGRVYLAGDACHIHSPVGGQGMNMGLQDAANLSWKLAMVINKKCGASLLETYNTERYNVDNEVLKIVDTATKAALIRNRFILQITKQVQRKVSQFQWLLDIFTKTVGQTAYTYKNYSNLSYEYWIIVFAEYGSQTRMFIPIKQ